MQIVDLKRTPVHAGGSCPAFVVKPYVRKDLNVGTEVFDVESSEVQYSHLEPILPKKYSYGVVEMILCQDMFHCIRQFTYFETDRKNSPIAVRLALGWVLSGPLPSTSSLFSTCFEAVAQRETGSKLANQICSWYDIESCGAYKQVNPRSAVDARAEKIF